MSLVKNAMDLGSVQYVMELVKYGICLVTVGVPFVRVQGNVPRVGVKDGISVENVEVPD